MDQSELVDRINRRLKELGRGAVEAARKGGLEKNYIRDLLNNRKESVREASLGKIAAGLDWSKEELLAQDSVNTLSDSLHSRGGASTNIPEIDVQAGAAYAGGFGQQENVPAGDDTAVSRDVIRAEWGFPTPFLREELRLRPGRVHILPIRGDSMVDALYDGDRAVVALDDTDVSQGGIFAIIDDNGSVIVKQVELLRTGKAAKRKILCTSRNKNYSPFELVLDDPVRIIGRVAAKVTRL